jgi:sugar phosphate isomerase/epimerase
MRITRREWHRMSLAGFGSALAIGVAPIVGAQAKDGTYRGVTLGVQSYSFRDRSLDGAIDAMQTLGLRSCELWQDHLEPRKVSREDMRRWRETVSLDEFRKVAERLTRAGISLSAYNISFRDDFSDAEIDRGFEMARALGAPCITASSNVKTAARVAPAAARHKMRVGMHNHSRIDANEFATPQNFEEAMKAGPWIVVNLDIGHFTAANFDAVDFLRRHHASIVTLHIKDRKRDQGALMPFGDGDSPIGPVLRLLRDQKWPIPANIEYEYKGGDTVEEVRRCLEYCRRQLDS